MPKFPIVYGFAFGILAAFVFAKFILSDNNLLLLLGCFGLAMGTLVALFEMKEMPQPGTDSPVKRETDS
ncbi:MAG: hypothetical protein QMC95_14010 [Desulfitobacteriaceae bacterium]|nr:hypothetical protein [Desulfitobacteriaceae bacterium]MDI6915313.1 hypothetical protein [Desulfitobacteriaceae bacterium]